MCKEWVEYRGYFVKNGNSGSYLGNSGRLYSDNAYGHDCICCEHYGSDPDN